jgi:ADP-heptose:LPS heptosyltransferase
VHDVQQNLNLLQGLDIDTNSSNTEYDFPLTTTEQTSAESFLSQNNINEKKIIGLHPGTNIDMIYKRWPIERWAKLADGLIDQFKAEVLIFGGPDENKLKEEVAKHMRHKPHNIALSLRDTAALMSKCSFFVSNDSGLMHIAVSQKIPTFGLFGPTDEGRTAPWGKYGHVIRAKGTTPTYDVTKLQEIRKKHEADETLLSLDVKTVFENITGIVNT